MHKSCGINDLYEDALAVGHGRDSKVVTNMQHCGFNSALPAGVGIAQDTEKHAPILEELRGATGGEAGGIGVFSARDGMESRTSLNYLMLVPFLSSVCQDF